MISIVVTISGADDVAAYIEQVAQLRTFGNWLDEQVDSLYKRLYETAPVKTGAYRDSIHKEFSEYEGDISIAGVSYAKALIEGGPTLLHAAQENRWPYTRVVGNLGILHDVRAVVYDWESKFKNGLNDVDFTNG